MKKTKLTLNAQTLRIMLIAALALLLVGGGVGFYYVQNMLRGYAKETSQLNSQAALTDQNLDALKKVQAYLASHQTVEEKVKKVVADSTQYKYQDDIVSDISKFASKSGVKIKTYTFSSSGGAGGGGTTQTAPASPSTAPAPSKTNVAGLKSTTVNVTIDSPVNYSNLLDFIHRIEQNLTKMQIASISLTRDESGKKNDVTSQAFDIEVYIR